MAWMPTFLENRCTKTTSKKLPLFSKINPPKITTLQDWCGIHWVRHCPWQCWGSQEEVWRKALEFWGWEAKESEMYRLCLGFKTLQVHDIVADPIGRYDMILSRHTLQVIVFFGWCVLFCVSELFCWPWSSNSIWKLEMWSECLQTLQKADQLSF